MAAAPIPPAGSMAVGPGHSPPTGAIPGVAPGTGPPQTDGDAGRTPPEWIPVDTDHVAGTPGPADEGPPGRERWSPPGEAGDLPDAAAHKPGFQPADVLLILLGLALALIVGPQFYLAFDVLFQGGTIDTGDIRAVDLWINSAVLLVVFGALPFFWVLGTRNEPWRGTVIYLRLHEPGRSALWGLGLGVGLILALVLVGFALKLADTEPENPGIAQLAAVMTVPLAIFLSLSAAVGEEILFRGVLQRWIGVWGQAAVFATLHAYQGIYGIGLTFLLAVLFGFMVKRGGSLWIAIVAHFVFNVVQMLLFIAYPEAV